MSDMLVKLYNIPTDFSFLADMEKIGVIVRKPIGPEKHAIVDWVREHFSDPWASEMDISMSGFPPTSWIATYKKELIGFSCFDSTCLGLFGPMGVHPDHRKKGIGKALLMACLVEMKLKGYAYCIIGSVGPTDFYVKTCGATIIEDSEPSVWYDMLRRKKRN